MYLHRICFVLATLVLACMVIVVLGVGTSALRSHGLHGVAMVKYQVRAKKNDIKVQNDMKEATYDIRMAKNEINSAIEELAAIKDGANKQSFVQNFHQKQVSVIEKVPFLIKLLQIWKKILDTRKKLQRAEDDLQIAKFEEGQVLFDKMDKDNSGFIECGELVPLKYRITNIIGIAKYNEILMKVDKDADGKLDSKDLDNLIWGLKGLNYM